MNEFLQKKMKSVGVVSKNRSIKVYVYTDENQTGLRKFSQQRHSLFFVSTERYFLKDALYMQSLEVIAATVDNLPEGFVDMVAIDCLEDFEGNLINVYQACVKKGFDLLLVTGMSQFDNFIKYDAFLKTLDNLVFIAT